MSIKQKETISLIEHFAVVAEKDLEIVLLKQRLANANNMVKSYMNEFEKRGLAYVPHVQTKQT
jgi:hypothetical protein